MTKDKVTIKKLTQLDELLENSVEAVNDMGVYMEQTERVVLPKKIRQIGKSDRWKPHPDWLDPKKVFYKSPPSAEKYTTLLMRTYDISKVDDGVLEGFIFAFNINFTTPYGNVGDMPMFTPTFYDEKGNVVAFNGASYKPVDTSLFKYCNEGYWTYTLTVHFNGKDISEHCLRLTKLNDFIFPTSILGIYVGDNIYFGIIRTNPYIPHIPGQYYHQFGWEFFDCGDNTQFIASILLKKGLVMNDNLIVLSGIWSHDYTLKKIKLPYLNKSETWNGFWMNCFDSLVDLSFTKANGVGQELFHLQREHKHIYIDFKNVAGVIMEGQWSPLQKKLEFSDDCATIVDTRYSSVEELNIPLNFLWGYYYSLWFVNEVFLQGENVRNIILPVGKTIDVQQLVLGKAITHKSLLNMSKNVGTKTYSGTVTIMIPKHLNYGIITTIISNFTSKNYNVSFY